MVGRPGYDFLHVQSFSLSKPLSEANEAHLLESVALGVGWLKSMPLLTLVNCVHGQKRQVGGVIVGHRSQGPC